MATDRTRSPAETTSLPIPIAKPPIPRFRKRRRRKSGRNDLEARVGNIINLKAIFPPSMLFALRKTVHWVVLWLVVAVGMVATSLRPSMVASESIWLDYGTLIFAALTIVVVSKYVYAELYKMTLQYRLEGFRLHVTRGVIFKEVGSVPLSPFGEVYVRRSALDILCGVHEFQLLLGLDPSKQFAKIEGLSKKSAFGLQGFVSEFLSKQLFVPPGDGKIRMARPQS